MSNELVDEDDEKITISHLHGEVCIVDNSIEFPLFFDKKTAEVRLQIGAEQSAYYVVSDVLDMTDDGGYVVDICNRDGKVVYTKTSLIKKSIYKKLHPKKR